jgi:hypothetical protein
LQSADISDVVKNSFVSQAPPVTFPSAKRAETSEAELLRGKDNAVAYPMVQPMKAALYFDNAKGFGDWKIFVSTAAIKDLRANRKKNPELCKIILKKMRCVVISHYSANLASIWRQGTL